MMSEHIKISVVVSSVIQKDGKFLLVQERKESAYGLWNLPGGRVDEGEELVDAAIREAKEETGYDVRLVWELLLYHKIPKESVKHTYEMEIIGGDLVFPTDELLDAQWFSYDEILGMKEKLRSPEFLLESLSSYFAKKSIPQ